MRIFSLATHLQTVAAFSAFIIGTAGITTEAVSAPTGKPVAYALTPGNTITAIDTGNKAVLGTIQLAAASSNLLAAPDGKHLYVVTSTTTNPQNPTVIAVVDTQTSTVSSFIPIDFAESYFATISSDGSHIYLVGGFQELAGAEVLVIDTTTQTQVISPANLSPYPQDVALSPDGKRLYIPTIGGHDDRGSLDVVDTTDASLLASLEEASFSQYYWAAVSPDSTKVFSYGQWTDLDTFDSGVVVYDTTTLKRTKIAAIPYPARLSLPLPNSNIMYGFSGGSILAYNVQSDAVTATVPVATTVNKLALTPDGKQLYVSDSNAQSIAIVDTATNTLTGSVAVAGATDIAITAAPPPPVLTPPTASVTLNPTSVPVNAPATLAWTSNGATSCTGSGAWSGAVDLQGSKAVSFATAGSSTYTLTCTGPGGMVAASAKLTVVPGSSLTASATDVPVNGTAVLTWKGFTGATGCSASGDWSGNLPASGSQAVGPYSGPGAHTFTLACGGANGYDQVTQTVSWFAQGPYTTTSLAPVNANVTTVAVPGTAPAGGGLDGHGNAYNLQDRSVPNPLTAFGQTFALGNTSKPSGLSKQKVDLGSVQLSNVTFLGAAVNANQLNQPFVVTYSDGTTQTYTQSLSQWGSPQDYAGETLAAFIGTRVTSTGALQQGAQGWYVYAYQITLDPTKVATSLQLPNNRNVVVLAINETKAPTAVPISIASSFNVDGLAAVGHPASGGGLDNHGYAFDTSLLPSGFSGAGQKFNLGPANAPDAVSNTTIALPAQTRVGLTVLATAVNANLPNQTFLVTYKDGSTTAFTQGVSQWGSPQHYPGELDARSTAFRITPAGVRQAGAWHVYAYVIPTDATKQVVSLTLPKNRNVVVFAVNSLIK